MCVCQSLHARVPHLMNEPNKWTELNQRTNEAMNPNRCCAVPFIGLAYDIMMTSYMMSWVFVCDVIIGCHITTLQMGVRMPCIRGHTHAKKLKITHEIHCMSHHPPCIWEHSMLPEPITALLFKTMLSIITKH